MKNHKIGVDNGGFYFLKKNIFDSNLEMKYPHRLPLQGELNNKPYEMRYSNLTNLQNVNDLDVLVIMTKFFDRKTNEIVKNYELAKKVKNDYKDSSPLIIGLSAEEPELIEQQIQNGQFLGFDAIALKTNANKEKTITPKFKMTLVDLIQGIKPSEGLIKLYDESAPYNNRIVFRNKTYRSLTM